MRGRRNAKISLLIERLLLLLLLLLLLFISVIHGEGFWDWSVLIEFTMEDVEASFE